MAGLTEMPKVGERVRYIGGDADVYENLTEGCIYDVDSIDFEGDAVILDDNGDNWYLLEHDNFAYYELVTEAVVEPKPDVHALLANLGRRLSEVEAEIEDAKDRKFYDDMVEAYADLDAEPKVFEGDAVNSPAHYKRGKFETIEVIEEITAGYTDGFVAHCAGTAIKYIARAPFKHATPTEDLRKAAKYLEFAIKRLEAEASE